MRIVAGLLLVGALTAGGQPLTDRERALLNRIEELEKRVSALEAKTAPPPAPRATPVIAVDAPAPLESASATTFNLYLDGYYGWNFNHPPNRVNALRFNDTLANNFTLNQAGIVIERAPDVAAGRRFGARVDLMFGQNTESLQGNAANEPRPAVYRNIFQAYGTYVAPVGSGLTLDFGKFASALGIEGNYAYEDINYSRSLLFTYMPAYHTGLRASYNISSAVSAQYWLVNGINQTEDFNGFKSNAFLVTLKPAKTVSWNLDYYFGREAPGGRALTRIFDSYLSWSPGRLTLAGEFDRVLAGDARFTGGAAYAQYKLTPKWWLGGRAEHIRDIGGSFTGTTQNVDEQTATATFQPADWFQLRLEYRRDVFGFLQRNQHTGTLGVIWWFGGKRESW